MRADCESLASPLCAVLATDVLVVMGDGTIPNLSFLRILRMLRILRVLRLLRSWRGLYTIIVTFGAAVSQISNLFVLMSLVMLIFALIGMQLFGGAYNPATGFSRDACPGGVCADPDLDELPHYHFDYFSDALQTVFVLMTGEWIDAMDPATATLGPQYCIYFIVVVVIGRFGVMNLFIGILLNAFADSEEGEEEEEEGVSQGGKPKLQASPATRSDGTKGAGRFLTKMKSKVALADHLPIDDEEGR
jgi:hypothetical protein